MRRAMECNLKRVAHVQQHHVGTAMQRLDGGEDALVLQARALLEIGTEAPILLKKHRCPVHEKERRYFVLQVVHRYAGFEGTTAADALIIAATECVLYLPHL